MIQEGGDASIMPQPGLRLKYPSGASSPRPAVQQPTSQRHHVIKIADAAQPMYDQAVPELVPWRDFHLWSRKSRVRTRVQDTQSIPTECIAACSSRDPSASNRLIAVTATIAAKDKDKDKEHKREGGEGNIADDIQEVEAAAQASE